MTEGVTEPPARPRWSLRHRWRRSLLLRVFSLTLVATLSLVVVVGVLLIHQVQRGLLAAEQRDAAAQATAGFAYAQAQLAASDATTPASQDRLLETTTLALDARGNGSYGVGLLPITAGAAGFYDRDTFDPASVPARLRSVVAGSQVLAGTYTVASLPGGRLPELLLGAPLATPNGDAYQLFFAFPLSAEAQTLQLVSRSLLLGGAVFVVLIVGLVWLATRRVVAPVRLAASVADRLAAGQLEERLPVRGDDELARLGTAFNAMAAGLQRQIRELEELSRLQQRFTADVSHELRTPLTTVRMAADVLHASRSGFHPEVARSAELLHTQLDRFQQLLEDLLEISRFDARAAVLAAEPVDVAELVRQEVARIEPLAEARATPLDCSQLPRAPVVAEIDPRRVTRIVRNLLTNAVEHAEHRPVRIAVAADAETVALTVRDSGVGLRPGEAALVFARFWRADLSRARHTGGTGLGLSIALEDARLHGGWLQAWGEPGAGAVFRLVLPRRAGAAVTSSPLPLQPPELVGHPGREEQQGTGAPAASPAPPASPTSPAPRVEPGPPAAAVAPTSPTGRQG